MKLSDVDKVTQLKETFIRLSRQLKVLENKGAYGGQLAYGGEGIDWYVVQAAVIPAAQSAMKKHVDELKAQLMLYGVDDFEGK
jgi:hypothetical protein